MEHIYPYKNQTQHKFEPHTKKKYHVKIKFMLITSLSKLTLTSKVP